MPRTSVNLTRRFVKRLHHAGGAQRAPILEGTAGIELMMQKWWLIQRIQVLLDLMLIGSSTVIICTVKNMLLVNVNVLTHAK